jgi:hypothetical protein
MPARHPPPKTLPLRWVVGAIVLFVGAYTFLRLHYGKRGKPFEPYHDLGERAATQRLAGLGYQRIPVDLERPAEPLAAARLTPVAAEVIGAFGGLPAELAAALADKPALPAAITGVMAPRETATAATYALQFTCAQPDYKTQINAVLLLRKDRQLFLLPNFGKIPGQLLARSKETVIFARFSTQSLPPGRYSVTLCGGRASKSWGFTVK